MKQIKGFTLAEIIISMTIIGVIAAITIPALLVSTNEKALDAQKKALQARMSQAISQIDDLRMYAVTDPADSSIDKSSALNFINNALKKVYRIQTVCGKSDVIYSCNFPETIYAQGSTTFSVNSFGKLIDFLDNSTAAGADTFGGLNTDIAGFVTSNGESVVLYYNPKCYGSGTNGTFTGNAASAMCINMIYDLNGKKGTPNEVGKDIGFITVFFPKDPEIVAPVTFGRDTVASSSGSFSDYTGISALCKNDNKSLIIPSIYEGMSIALNKKLTNVASGKYVVSAAGSTNIYYTDSSDLTSGTFESAPSSALLRCIYNK